MLLRRHTRTLGAVASPAGPVSLWPGTDAPAGAVLHTDGGANIETATEMRSSIAGTITHVRVLGYGAGDVDGAVWLLNAPTVAAGAVVVTETVAAGELLVWQELALPDGGVHVAANTAWVVAARNSAGRYFEDTNAFIDPVISGVLTGPADGSAQVYPNGSFAARNGRFALAVATPGGTLPVDTASNMYFADVVFVPD